MPESVAEHNNAGPQAPKAREVLQATPTPEQKQSAHSGGEHGGVYTRFRELAAVSGGQEPPPDQFFPLFRKSEFSHPANNAQKARVLGFLQQQYGNRYVQRVLSPNAQTPASPLLSLPIQRHEAHHTPESSADSSSTPQINRSGDQPLERPTQTFMESRFGHDFSRVRVHDDSQSHQAAKGLNAEAFTTGRDIYFSQGAYHPSSQTGQKLIAHELVHVVQQDQGMAGARPHGFSVSQPYDPLERQADAASEAVMRGEMFPAITASSTPVLHRQAQGSAAPALPPRPTPPGAPAAPRPGDFPITVAGTTVVLPTKDLLDKAVPGNKLSVPDRYLKKVPAIPAFKLTEASLDLDDDKTPTGATVGVALKVPPLEGQGSLTVDKSGSASGSVHVVFRSDKIPGLKQTEIDVQVKKDNFAFDATIDFDLPKVTGQLAYKYRDGKHSGKGKAGYDGAKLKGSIEIIMSEAGLISGSGMLDMELFKGLKGQVEVAVDEKRNIQVKGKLSVPGQVELFPEKKYEKSFFSFEKKFPIWGITIPVIDVNVGIFAEIHAGAGFRAKFGPGVLRDIALTGEFGTDPEAATEFGLGGEFFVPAGAEIVVNVGGGIGLRLAVADITGGIEAVGVAGLYTALTVRPQFKYAGSKYTISGMAELAGVAQVKFGINAFAKIDVGVWLFKGTVWRKDWTLAEWIWNTGLNIALRANVSYTLGDDFAPDISFETGQVDPEKFVKDVMPESGSPVPAPPKPPVPDKGSFNAEGAAGTQATGAAPGAAPAPPTPGAPPAKTQPGSPGGAAAGPEGPQPPGAESPEHTKQVQAGLAAIDEEQKGYVTNGQILKSEAEQVAAKVKKDHPVFKSITVVDGDKTWDYDYVASPGKKKKGMTKEEASKALEAYDAKLNAAGKIEGTFNKFDWSDYDFTTDVPPVHPANIRYGHPQGPAVPKPSGPYVIGGRTTGGPNYRDWIDNVVSPMRDGKKEELRAEADKGKNDGEKRQKVLEKMGLQNDPVWNSKGGSVGQLINWLGEWHVRQTLMPDMPF